MKIPITWLKDYIDFDNEVDLMHKLTSVGHMQDGPPVKIGDTHVYDLEVRQNRPDCLSLIGIAREAAAVLGTKLRSPMTSVPTLPEKKGETKAEIQSENLCYRFNTITLEGLKVAESPIWLKDKLVAYGIKSINNIVDITNFVMVELGQPLHAFDRDKIIDSHIIIRPAKKGETLTVLGGKKLTLNENDLVIADTGKIVALAGVMGGEETSVTDKTTSIILEAATYNQATIRRSTLKHTLRTEASTRLEKFLHPRLTEIALSRAVHLILELCGGTVIDTTDNYPKKFEEKTISLDIQHLKKLGGVKISTQEAKDILLKLELEVDQVHENTLSIGIPYFRTDLELEEDLVEEVLRIHGYDLIPVRLPQSPPPTNIDSPEYFLEEELKDLLIAAGLDEQITEPLTKEDNPRLKPVTLENSLNVDKTMLRTTLKDSLYRALENQLKFRKEGVELFEIGKIYFKENEEYKEKPMLGVITRQADFFETKGLVDLLKERFDTEHGLHDLTIEILDAEESIYFFELPIEKIKAKRVIKPLSEPPHVVLADLSFFVPLDTKVGELIEAVCGTSSLLRNVKLGEEPKSKGNEKTLFLHLEFSSATKNLTKEDVEPEKKKIVKLLHDKYGAKVR